MVMITITTMMIVTIRVFLKKHNRAFQLMMSLVCAGQVLSLQSHMH